MTLTVYIKTISSPNMTLLSRKLINQTDQYQKLRLLLGIKDKEIVNESLTEAT